MDGRAGAAVLVTPPDPLNQNRKAWTWKSMFSSACLALVLRRAFRSYSLCEGQGPAQEEGRQCMVCPIVERWGR